MYACKQLSLWLFPRRVLGRPRRHYRSHGGRPDKKGETDNGWHATLGASRTADAVCGLTFKENAVNRGGARNHGPHCGGKGGAALPSVLRDAIPPAAGEDTTENILRRRPMLAKRETAPRRTHLPEGAGRSGGSRHRPQLGIQRRARRPSPRLVARP